MLTDEKPMTPQQMVKAREKLGFTQNEMGEKLDTSRRFIQYREGGEVPIDAMTKYAICWLLIPQLIRNKYLAKFFR